MNFRSLVWLAPLFLLSCSGEDTSGNGDLETYVVQRGDLQVLVREHGEVQAGRSMRVSSELDGDATLIYLIPEGTRVDAGDKLVELDVSEMREKEATQGISVAKAAAALEQSEKNFEIMENGLVAAREAGESSLQIAQMRVDKFIGEQPSADRPSAGDSSVGTNGEMVEKLRNLLAAEIERNTRAEANYGDLVNEVLGILGPEENLQLEMGEMANQILRQIDNIALAWADLELAKDKVVHSKILLEKKFITRNEYERDDIAYRRQLSSVTLAWNDLELLIKFTLKENKIQLAQNVNNANLNLQSIIASNEASRVREEAELASARAEFQLASERLDNYRDQIQKATIRSPTPGIVVYSKARGGRRGNQTMEEGVQVHQRQELINLPDVTKMIVEFNVHEAQIDMVAATQKAIVIVDAFPERVFTGTVTRVGALPDSSAQYNNTYLKVYRARLELDGENSDGSLRPGMNATVEILVQSLKDAILVPMTAIQLQHGVPYVWKVTRAGPVTQWVTLGTNDLNLAEILEGLDEGEEVYLGTPPGAVAPSFAGPDGDLANR